MVVLRSARPSKSATPAFQHHPQHPAETGDIQLQNHGPQQRQAEHPLAPGPFPRSLVEIQEHCDHRTQKENEDRQAGMGQPVTERQD